MVLPLAMRNLALNAKRYAILFAAVTAGFTFVILITGLVLGARETVKEKAARYFAGDVSIVGYASSKTQSISDPEAVIVIARGAGRGILNASPRTVYYRTDCNLFFAGSTIRQRRLVGADFEREAAEFAGLRFVSGGIGGMKEGNGILISKVAAKTLGANVGDDVNLLLTTDTGQYNSATLYVRGVFDETSLFGYAAYVRRDELNALMGRRADSATDIALFASEGVSLSRLAAEVREGLSRAYPVLPRPASRDALAAAVEAGVKADDTMAVITLDANLSQIKDLINAIMAIMYFVLAVFVAIVMIGILNTYRIIVYERTEEIGAMRAMGMRRGVVARLFLYEAAGLGLAASCCGLALGVMVLAIVSRIDLGALPAAGMFTESGRLSFFLDAKTVAANFLIIVTAVMAAAWGPAARGSRVEPAEALRGDR